MRVCCVLLAVMFASAWADISYIDENGVEQVKFDGEYTEFTDDMETTDIPGGWYAVTGSVTYERVTSDGDLYFILADGAKLLLKNSTSNNIEARNIFIYGQKAQTGKLSIKSLRSYGIHTGRDVLIAGGQIDISSDVTYDKGYGIYGDNITKRIILSRQ